MKGEAKTARSSQGASTPWVKRINAIVSAAILVLFAIHGTGNALQLFGVGSIVPATIGWTMLGLACVHAIIGVVLTVQTLREQVRAGAAYPRLNKRFWAVRASGFALVVCAAFHVLVFGGPGGEFVRLAFFGHAELVMHLLMMASLAVHVLCNMEPLLIDLGLPAPRGRAADAMVVFAVLLIIAAAAFVFYFVRWAVF